MAFAVIKRGAQGDGYFAVPLHGSSFFISASQFTHYKLQVEQQLSEHEFIHLLAQIQTLNCRKTALDALARREHSRQELELKLRRKNIPLPIIEEVLDQLQQEKLLDERRFCQQFILSRQKRNPEGRTVLLQRLRQKGVDSSTANEAVDAYFSEDENLSSAIAKAIQRAKRTDGSVEDLKRHLLKKGFLSYQIKAYFEEQ